MTVNFQELQNDVSTIKEVVFSLQEKISQVPDQPTDNRPISIGEAAEFLGVTPQTIYQNIKKVPHRKRFGRLYFFKAELLEYLDGKGVSRD